MRTTIFTAAGPKRDPFTAPDSATVIDLRVATDANGEPFRVCTTAQKCAKAGAYADAAIDIAAALLEAGHMFMLEGRAVPLK